MVTCLNCKLVKWEFIDHKPYICIGCYIKVQTRSSKILRIIGETNDR